MSPSGRRLSDATRPDGTVLVVDASEAFVDRMGAALSRHAPAVAVTTATDSDAALSSLATVDCVLVGTDADAWTRPDFVATIHERVPTVPVVAVADSSDVATVEALLDTGVTDIVGPDDPEPLLTARVRRAVAEHSNSNTPDESGETLGDLKQRALDEADLGVVIAEASTDTPTVFANEGFGRLTGYDPGEFVGRNCRILQGRETDEASVASIREALASERPVSVVLQNYHKDGTPFWNEVEIEPISDDDGAVTHFLGFQRDVTARKELQRELDAGQRSLRGLYRVTTDASLSLDERIEKTLALACDRLDVDLGFVTRIEDDTQRIVHAVGDHPLLQPGEACPLSKSYCRRTLDTEGLLAVVHAAADEAWEDDPAYDEFGLECYLGGKVHVGNELFGTLCFADTKPRSDPFTDAQATFVELLTRWVSYELERERRERDLRLATRRFRALFDNPRTFVGVLDPDGTVREANETALSTLDDPHRVLDEPLWTAPWWTSDEESAATVRTAVEQAADGTAAPFECSYASGDGSGTISATIYPVYGSADDSPPDDERVVSLMLVGTDTSKRTEQAEQLRRQRDRLEEFASVVSHDLRSPLEVARGRLHLYETTGDADNVQQANAAIDRMSTLIDDLLELARQGDTVSDPASVQVASVARQAWSTVATDAASLVVDLDPAFTLDADPSRLRQLFENLFRNCVEHGSTGSRSETGDSVEHGSTSSRPKADDNVVYGSTATDPLTVRLVGLAGGRRGFAVEDDGVGIDAADREHVFDRGFTTNAEGTGFGLAIVRRVADAHGWTIGVAESDRGGARFEISLDG